MFIVFDPVTKPDLTRKNSPEGTNKDLGISSNMYLSLSLAITIISAPFSLR